MRGCPSDAPLFLRSIVPIVSGGHGFAGVQIPLSVVSEWGLTRHAVHPPLSAHGGSGAADHVPVQPQADGDDRARDAPPR